MCCIQDVSQETAPAAPSQESKSQAAEASSEAPPVPPANPPASVESPPALPTGPQPLQSLHSATVTDPESGARVTTRSDLLMIIDYVTGDRVAQDSDGTRVTSYASGGFMVESAGLPTVRGTPNGVAVEPTPGNMCPTATQLCNSSCDHNIAAS